MKLAHHISLRLQAMFVIVFAAWSVFFYFAIIDEVNDEVDDSLEDYAEVIIRRKLAGLPLPSADNGTNNQYFIREVSDEHARTHKHVRYEDRDVYIEEKHEFEPARIITYLFTDNDGRHFEVEVFVPTIDKDDLKEAILLWILFLWMVFVVGIAVLTAVTVRHSIRPLHRLLGWLDSYKVGKPMPVFSNPTRIDELQRLNTTVANYVERTHRYSEEQKLFIGNASHELQTPIAVCQNRLEMLLDEGQLTQHQAEEVVKTLSTLRDMARLNRSLLLLGKIDNGHYSDRREVDLGALSLRLLNDLKTVYAPKGIEVEVEGMYGPVVSMDTALAAMLVNNLLKNAFVHNEPHGRVRLVLDRHALTVANTCGTEPLDATKVFMRFYHTPGRKASSGLGLPIVKSVCEESGLTIGYAFSHGLHTFTVSQ